MPREHLIKVHPTQAATMESLGFEQREDFSAIQSGWIGHGITVHLLATQPTTPAEAAWFIVEKAKADGIREIRAEVRKALGL